jgi:anti-sigma regulatory factor (Ser/Thr protein kinase)
MTTPRRHAGDSASEDSASADGASEDSASEDSASEDSASGEWRLVSRILVPCQVRAVKAARDHVARHVAACGLHPLLDDVGVVTSEIVTNAIMHGSPAGLAVLLEVAVTADAVRVSVLDYSDPVPVLRELSPDGAQSGRGLHLIDSLAKSWGHHACQPDGFTKVVWAELA